MRKEPVMDTGQGVLHEYKAAVEGGRRLRAAHVRSLLARKSAGCKPGTGKIGRAPLRAPRHASGAAT